MKDSTEVTKRLLDLMEAAYSLVKQQYPEVCQLSMFASDDGTCVAGFREAMCWDNSRIVDGYKSPEGNYQIRAFIQ